MTSLTTSRKTLTIGTRGSALARWQTEHVAALLKAHYPDLNIEIRVISTKGDTVLDRSLPMIGGKGLFTAELEAELREGIIDAAVHSLKDLPTENAEGLTVGAIPERAPVADVLISRENMTLDALPHGATIGTSSRRRAAQLHTVRPDFNIIDIRGNVETRVSKVNDDSTPYDATLLASAGVTRLEMTHVISEVLPLDLMLPAPGQGALGIQCRDDDESRALFASLTHAETRLAVTAERAFLGTLGGGCSVPVAAYAHVMDAALHLHGRVLSLNGETVINVMHSVKLSADDAYTAALELGQQAAADAIAQGANVILKEVES